MTKRDATKRRVEFCSSIELPAFQRALVDELAALGWDAVARHSVSDVAYRSARSRLARFAVRLRAYGIYPLRLAARFARSGDDTIAVVTSNTFYAPWCAGWRARRGPLIHWVFDLFPDVLIAAHTLPAHGRRAAQLRKIIRTTFLRADANVFLGERLLAHAEEQFGPIPRTWVIPIGADAELFQRRPENEDGATSAGVVRVLYCGNLGRMHEIDTLLGADRSGIPARIQFEFRGHGAEMARLRAMKEGQRGPGASWIFADALPDSEWVSAMCAAPIALVTLKRGAEALLIPSKAYSALVAGQAIIAICARESDLAALVRKYDAGWVIEPGESRALVQLLDRIVHHPGELAEKRRHAWQAGQQYFGQRTIARQWNILLESMGARDSAPSKPISRA